MFCENCILDKGIGAYHDAEAEAGDDGVLDGDGSKGDGADVAGEELSDGAKGVLAKGREDGRASQVPQLLGLHGELPEEISGAGDRRDVIGFRRENCSVSPSGLVYRCEQWLALVIKILHGHEYGIVIVFLASCYRYK